MTFAPQPERQIPPPQAQGHARQAFLRLSAKRLSSVDLKSTSSGATGIDWLKPSRNPGADETGGHKARVLERAKSHNPQKTALANEATVEALPLPAPSPSHQSRPQPLITVKELRRHNGAIPAASRLKRSVDVGGAITGLLLFGPLMLLIAAALAFERGPIFFGHERVGQRGTRFRCLKFRTMVPDAQARLDALLASDPKARAEWEKDRKLSNDPRITPVGHFLRVTSLDELPQFFNVLLGQMSLVGPRPVTPDELKKYARASSLYLSCRPGITGLWQVSGRSATTYARRVALDSHYARKFSLWLDAWILARTFGVVLKREGAQ